MEDVVQAPVAVGPFQGQHVHGFFHHADLFPVALAVGADGTGANVGEVLALSAEHDALLDGVDGVGQVVSFLFRQANDEVSQALGALGADAGQLVQFLDKPRQRRGGGWQVFQGHVTTIGVNCSGWDSIVAGTQIPDWILGSKSVRYAFSYVFKLNTHFCRMSDKSPAASFMWVTTPSFRPEGSKNVFAVTGQYQFIPFHCAIRSYTVSVHYPPTLDSGIYVLWVHCG